MTFIFTAAVRKKKDQARGWGTLGGVGGRGGSGRGTVWAESEEGAWWCGEAVRAQGLRDLSGQSGRGCDQGERASWVRWLSSFQS